MTRSAGDGLLLLAEDDPVFARVMTRALAARGFQVLWASRLEDALSHAQTKHPRYAVIDLKLGDDNGLDLIPVLRSTVGGIRILLLTGYASIATAVEAIKRGADDYLAKPVSADVLVHALLETDEPDPEDVEPPDTPLPLPRLEWEHIQRTLLECGGNVSEAARRLGMYRRTLQRKLAKHPVRERPQSQ